MWTIESTADYEKEQKKWPKKWRRELRAMLNNLDTFCKALQMGAKPSQAKYGFVHREGRGILAIDQKGGGSGLTQTRLYVYPDEESQFLYLIAIGPKGTKANQSKDVQRCHHFVARLQKREDN